MLRFLDDFEPVKKLLMKTLVWPKAISVLRRLIDLPVALERAQVQLGGLNSRAVGDLGPGALRDAEFRVFSQFGEDGIIQFLVQRVLIEHPVFVEFGVEDYRESNTRFLATKDNWRGLILDAGQRHRRFLESSDMGWRHHVDAVSAFIDRDNINRLITSAGIEGDIGLLSIDLDGNDFWVLEAIEVVSPRILVAEYNSTFGPEKAVTIPYDPAFVRHEAHYSGLYWGASLAALTQMADRKNYALVGGNATGSNAFFVRRDVLGALPEVAVVDVWKPATFRDARTPQGEFSYLSDPREKLRLIRHLPLWNVTSSNRTTIAEVYAV